MIYFDFCLEVLKSSPVVSGQLTLRMNAVSGSLIDPWHGLNRAAISDGDGGDLSSTPPRGRPPGAWAALPRGIMGSFTSRTTVLPASVCSETLSKPRMGLGLAELHGRGFIHRLRAL